MPSLTSFRLLLLFRYPLLSLGGALVLREAPGAIILDNVISLEGAALAACLTQENYQDRVVGSSNMLRVPNRCLGLATGNNPDLSDEITRRVVEIAINAGEQDPDLREGFKHPNLSV